MENSNLIRSKPDLENMLKIHSISKSEKAYLDGLERKLGEKIIRQVKFGKWLVDGLTEYSGVVIEFDGDLNHQSEQKQLKDEMRDRELIQDYQIKAIYRLAWFDFIKNYQDYLVAMDRAVEFSAKDIKTLIKFSKIKN